MTLGRLLKTRLTSLTSHHLPTGSINCFPKLALTKDAGSKQYSQAKEYRNGGKKYDHWFTIPTHSHSESIELILDCNSCHEKPSSRGFFTLKFTFFFLKVNGGILMLDYMKEVFEVF